MAGRTISLQVNFQEYAELSDLPEDERILLEKAVASCSKAYAPYSDFHVGAAVLLANGQIILGNNQENAAYPSGICAERTALFYAGANFPGVFVQTIALSCHSKHAIVDKPLTPCGACRQVISEYESRQNLPIRIIMSGVTGPILACNGIDQLLPLRFKGEFVKK